MRVCVSVFPQIEPPIQFNMFTWPTQITDLLKIDYPIVQAPMLGVTTPEMVAAVSNNGGLGSLPVGGLPPRDTSALIRRTKELTGKPFAVNIFAHEDSVVDLQVVAAMQDLLEKFCSENQLPYQKQPLESLRSYSYKEQLDVILDEDIPILSFTFGVPDENSRKALQARGIVLIGTATSPTEARYLEEQGIDIITAQGSEAGGHRGTFLPTEQLPLIGSISLVSLVEAEVERPILSAGGIHNGRTIRAALMSGASGVQIGTAFVGCEESKAAPSYKSALKQVEAQDIVLTRAFSGRWARGIKNKFISEIEKSGIQIPGYPMQVLLTTPIRISSYNNDRIDFIPLWAGQSCSTAEIKPAKDVLSRLIAEAEAYK
jgi:nitronate monooxygenase